MTHDFAMFGSSDQRLGWARLMLGNWNYSSSTLLVIATIFIPLVVTVCYAIYNAYLHPLRHYPGPFLWRSFRMPYVIATQRGELHKRLKKLHTNFGPIVRIAPNELSYADGGAWKDIYLNRVGVAPFERNRTWFMKMTPDEPNSILGPDEDDHARFRRAFANSFSDKSLRDYAPVVERYVDLFLSKLKEPDGGRRWTEKTVDMEKWINYLIFDLVGDLAFGESFGQLEDGKLHAWVEIAADFGKGLALIASVNQYPPIRKLLRHIIPKHILQRSKDHREMSCIKTRKRLALRVDRPDFVTPTKKFNDQKGLITDPEWEINMLIIAFAASETIASALTAIVRELVQHQGVLHRLTNDIRAKFPQEAEITMASTSDIPYLDAVINEGLRLDPPVVIGIPRVVPPGGATVCDQYVPGGTYVTYNQHAANRQSYNFRNPNSFIPERFLDPDNETDDMASFQPFQSGRHVCPGMKLANTEMRFILAKLLWSFELSLAKESDKWDWGDQKTYVLWASIASTTVS
ncbi:benzoate 4-monooxygenase cytochrome P450 [Setomelanomma holmii]|uniref:Benzoate 4-monooxygenase cytochrome P450 n=1 Tax=Setomelanomma holmii TaxID=210430 RepID=A0A9P4H9M1_9PLEO|nr:benzoate 4-monooxygenase cytochrome P450 [Setomelanomma holmii]